MMNTLLKISAFAAASATLATAVPATAAVSFADNATTFSAPGTETYNNWRDRRGYRDDYRRGYRDDYRYSGRNWRGNDGRYYCRRGSGTTGLLLGGAGGALLGRSIDGGRDRTLGTVIGAAAGALAGRAIDRGGSRCR